jgi:elongation factor G
MERTVVHGEVPEAELTRYAIVLRSLTAGTGHFARRFARYEVVPQHVAAQFREPAKS